MQNTISQILTILMISFCSSLHASFGTAGEGFTVEIESGSGDFSWRRFTAPMAEDLCRDSLSDMTLAFEEKHRQASVHTPFALTTLNVKALDANGNLVPKVPVTMNISRPTPRALRYDQYEMSIQAYRPTEVAIEIVSYCHPQIRTYQIIKFLPLGASMQGESLGLFQLVDSDRPECTDRKRIRVVELSDRIHGPGYVIDWIDPQQEASAWTWLKFAPADNKKRLTNSFFFGLNDYERFRMKKRGQTIEIQQLVKSCQMAILCGFWQKQTTMTLTQNALILQVRGGRCEYRKTHG